MSELIVEEDNPRYKQIERLLHYDVSEMNAIIEFGIHNFTMAKKYKELLSCSNVLSDTERTTYEERLKTLECRNDDIVSELRKEKFLNTERIYEAKEEERRKYEERIEYKIDILKEKHKSRLEESEALVADLRGQLETIRNSLHSEIQEHTIQLKQEHTDNVNFLKTLLDEEKQNSAKLLKLFNTQVEKEVEIKTIDLKERVDDLRKKNDYLTNLYVDKNKGSYYESELLPRLEEYNDKHMGNIWRITHVGSKCSEKGDFHFRHKDTGDIILLDTKNNDTTSPVKWKDVEKFLRDINNPDNNAIGGILLANSRIIRKKVFEIENTNNRIGVYVSNFCLDNIGFIFSMLDLIMDMRKQNTSLMGEDELVEMYIRQYKFLQDRIRHASGECRKCESELSRLKEEFSMKFSDDIEVILNKDKKVKVQHGANTDILDYDELERERTVKLLCGKDRTKYYLQYEEDDKKYIQYFKSNYNKTKRMESLERKKKKKSTEKRCDNEIITLTDLL